MGDLGVSNRPRFKSQTKEPSTALARLTDSAPGIARKVAGAAVAVDSVLDRVPLIPYEAPKAPTRGERIAAGAMAVVYTAGGGLSIIPLVGPWTASAIIAAGGAAARALSPNPEVQNQGNLALQTTGYSAAVTLLDFGLLGFGSVPYFRAAAKSALVAVRG